MKEALEWVLQHSMIPAGILEWNEDTQSFLIGFMAYDGTKIGLSVEPYDVTEKQTILRDLQILYGNFLHKDIKTYRA